jgi:hypothetical protein
MVLAAVMPEHTLAPTAWAQCGVRCSAPVPLSGIQTAYRSNVPVGRLDSRQKRAGMT